MDELTCAGKNVAAGFGELSELRKEAWSPAAFGLTPCPEKDLAGGNLEENLRIMGGLLSGRAPEGLLATIAANAGAAFFIAEKADDFREGATLAKDLILNGTVRNWLERAKAFYAENSNDTS